MIGLPGFEAQADGGRGPLGNLKGITAKDAEERRGLRKLSGVETLITIARH